MTPGPRLEPSFAAEITTEESVESELKLEQLMIAEARRLNNILRKLDHAIAEKRSTRRQSLRSPALKKKPMQGVYSFWE